MATYYLNADTGNDTTGAGTSVSPWKTIAKALTVTVPGDTIYLQTSTAHYTWATAYFPTPITVQGQTLAGAVIDAAGAFAQWNITDITLVNLRFTNNIATTATPMFAPAGGTTSATNCQFDNLVVYAEPSGGNGGIFKGSTFTLNFTTCVFYNITANILASLSIMFRATLTLYGTWINCTIFLNAGTAAASIQYIFDPSNIDISFTNCIFQNSGVGVPVLNHFAVVGGTFTYNNTYGVSYGTITPGVGCITADSLFVDPTNGNLNLRPTSPCINAGTIF